MGRYPKTPEAHKQNGTYKKHRHANRGTKIAKIENGIEAPITLYGKTKEMWEMVIPELAKAGLITIVDAPQLEHAFLCYQMAQECLEVVNDEGVKAQLSDMKTKGKPPAIRTYIDCMREWESILWKYGMTPVEACRIRNNVKPEEKENEILLSMIGNG